MLTGKRERWDKIRVWGCHACIVVPKKTLAKVPGIVNGGIIIIVGYAPYCNGYRVFDPESRRYSTVGSIYFYESANHRAGASSPA